MFAVIKTGGKQYRVSEGQILKFERIPAEIGAKVQFDEVLLLGGDPALVGTPTIEGAAVIGEVVDQIRGKKVLAFKRRRRKHSSKRLKGHRQYLSVIRITGIVSKGAKPGDESETAIKARAAQLSAEEQAAKATEMNAYMKAKEEADAKRRAERESARASRVVTVRHAKDPEKEAAKAAKKAEAEAKVVAKADAKVKSESESRAKVETKAKAVAPEPQEDDFSAIEAAADPSKPDNLLDEPMGGKPDNLSKLPGVDEEMQFTLYEHGIFHMWQIDEWGSAHWAWFEQTTGQKVDRRAWVTVTRTIVRKKGKPKALPGSRPGNLRQVPTGERDDFELLPETSKELEELLYDLGVFHFSQIAAWSDDETTYVKAWLEQRGVMAPGAVWFNEAKKLAK